MVVGGGGGSVSIINYSDLSYWIAITDFLHPDFMKNIWKIFLVNGSIIKII